MAQIFSLSIECGDKRSADAMAEYLGQASLIEGSGTQAAYDFGINEDPEGNWWAGITPQGFTQAGPRTTEERLRATSLGRQLYQHIKTAPPFRYATVGIEVDGFSYFSELSDALATWDFHGLVLSEHIWRIYTDASQHFIPFSPGYYWKPWRGEMNDEVIPSDP